MGTISEFVRRSLLVSLPCLWLMISLEGGRNLWAQSDDIPQVLQPWKDWVLWEVDGKVGPSPFNDPNKRLKFWPSEMQLEIFPDRASFQLGVRVFDESWVPLPGDSGMWPQEVESQEGALPVLLRDGHPSIRLAQGTHRIRGKFPWSDVPQKIMLPKTIGIVSLRRDNALVPEPLWDDSGFLWLSRQPIEKTEQNLLAAKVYRLLEDGIPLWLRTEVDLSVSGKSREEDLGTILPEGWRLSSIEGSVPVAIDDQGKMLVQVRPGNWKIEILAFRTRDFAQFQFAEGSRPTVATELIGFKPNPSLRIAELEGLSAIDVQQTTFPEAWRAWPVFQWPTQSRFHLSEKLRGMGAQEPKASPSFGTCGWTTMGEELRFKTYYRVKYVNRGGSMSLSRISWELCVSENNVSSSPRILSMAIMGSNFEVVFQNCKPLDVSTDRKIFRRRVGWPM